MEVARDSVAAILAHFDLSPGVFPFTDGCCEEIESRRDLLGELLLFDILLRSGNIRDLPGTLYPPRDIDTFHLLLEKITLSSYDRLKQDCLVYFLLKWYRDGREERFKTERCIPPHFAALSDAYWNLDAGVNVPQAVSTLADSRLNTDYASKILQAISLAENPMPLILKYVRTAKPLLIEPDDIDLYTLALAESNLSEAWRFQRTFNEQNPTRSRLVEKIIDWSLNPPRRNALQQLLGIALSPFEQNIVEKYATPPSTTLSPTGIATLQNLLCVRLVQTGLFADAIKLDRRFSGASSANLPLQKERTKMMDEVYAALPLAERTMLDVELATPPTKQNIPTNGTRSNREMDTSMSWEDLRDSRPSIMQATPQKQPLFASLNGKLQDTPKFAGFGIPVNHTPSTFPLVASTSVSKPVVPPISSNTPQNAFSSLTQSTMRPIGPPSRTSPPKTLFESANRRQNAFYRPPVATPASTSVFRDSKVADNGIPPLSIPQNIDIEMADQSVVGVEPAVAESVSVVDPDDEELAEEEEGEDADASLAYSVFSSKPLARPKQTAPTANKRSRQSKTAPKRPKRRPPGAFTSDDDHEEVAADLPAQPPPPARQTRKSTKSTAAYEPEQPPIKSTRRRAKEKKDQGHRLSRTLPGSLMASEDDEDDGSEEQTEEADSVGPLPPRAEASSTASNGPGMQTRRRSSRLSSVESASASVKASRTKSASTGRKRRTDS
ncbi:ELYS domain-containing protein [Mycena indigotica]|uniref:ELYS domain-containing protein n=1 Tax=Mycena indigotica TaxID=2126181 RepID=A0A8H6TI83_9AGAR|nr:ELYS domain-containing protein [Mycena indigotica]KAF7316210.1 ELYS domain-containing protein [Mycena indigotica]